MNVDIKVEIPSHTFSFSISLASDASVRDLKHAIFEKCQGKPAVDGQRLITKGRVLKDNETIDSIWVSPDFL